MKINIKTATETDIKNIATIYVFSLKKAFSNFLLSSTIDKFSIEDKEIFLNNLLKEEKGNIFIAENIKNKEIAGYIIYKKIYINSIEIISFYVSKDYIKYNIGQQLLKTLKIFCRDCYISNIVLWTFKNNKEPINFYKKLGFIETGFQRESRIEEGQIEVQYILKV